MEHSLPRWWRRLVTDNAANEQCALRPEWSLSVQQQTKAPLFRTPCLSHTVNLAIQDFIDHICPPEIDTWVDMTMLQNALPHSLRLHPFYGMPKIIKTRWLSLGQFFEYFISHFAEVNNFVFRLAEPDHTKISTILNRYNFHSLAECFRVWNGLIRWTEGEEARLCLAFRRMLDSTLEFNARTANGNPYASQCCVALFVRILGTADHGQLLLAFLVTEDGIKWFRSLPDVQFAPILPYSKATVFAATYPLLSHFRTIFGADPGLFDGIWQHYLASELWTVGQPPEQFWSQRLGPWGEHHISWFPLAQTALILIRLPCSEAAVERAFSHLRYVLGTRRQSMGEDLLDAILVIRLNASVNIQDLDHRLASLETRAEPERGYWTETQLGYRIQSQIPGGLRRTLL
jgi:hypothetical protein